jgi:hypothetical protein
MIDQMSELAKDLVDLDSEDADILPTNKVQSSEFLVLTEEKLFKQPYKMPGRSATKLLMAIEKIKYLSSNLSKNGL